MRLGCTASFVLEHLSHSTGSGIEREPFQEGVSWGPQRLKLDYCREVAKEHGCVFSLRDLSSTLRHQLSAWGHQLQPPHLGCMWLQCYRLYSAEKARLLCAYCACVPVMSVVPNSVCGQGMDGAIPVILFLLELSLEGRSQDSCFLLGVLSLPSPFPSYICRTQCGDLLGQTEESWDSPGTNPCGCL